MHQTRRIPIVELNDYLTCKLCKGYFIDATTIIECLHTFCRSCIVRYLQTNKYCPVCDVQVHKTKPLLNIRPDKTLQDIIYKLVPRLYQNEMCRRREFYATHPEGRPSNLEQCGEASYQHILSPDETICISLSYHDGTQPPRYLRCPAAVSVVHLQKLIRSKYDLSEYHRIDVLHNQDCLNSHLTLIDIAYIYLWRRKGPLELTYRIYENAAKRLKLEEGAAATVSVSTDGAHLGEESKADKDPSKVNNEWKEVQLRISESGEMCITGIDNTVVVDNPVTSNLKDTKENDRKAKEQPSTDLIPKKSSQTSKRNVTTATTSTTMTIDTSTNIRNPSLTLTAGTTTTTTTKATSIRTTATSNDTGVQSNGKHKIQTNRHDEEPVPSKQLKQKNPSGVHGLSNNHPLKRHSQTRRSLDAPSPKAPVVTTSSFNFSAPAPPPPLPLPPLPPPKPPTPLAKPPNNSIVTTTATTKWPNAATTTTTTTSSSTSPSSYPTKINYCPVINVPKMQPPSSANLPKNEQKLVVQNSSKPGVRAKSSSPIGYKTLRDPPKQWNPQVSRASLLKSPDSKLGEVKSVRPAKFFKMRNNMPRYLGNPASGVKPLYHVHNSPDKDKLTLPQSTASGGNAGPPALPQPQPPTTSSSSTSTVTEAAATAEGKAGPKTNDEVKLKNRSILKIDPKTLKPLSDLPSPTHHHQSSDLIINTSSVPIFNPLKLQSSPKNDRKSPKSPQSSPKPKTSPPSSSNKRDKLSLNYTPPNPFIPNLTSPTLSPNQFLYPPPPPPPGPPGFPTYDPRIMAAYHNLLYGQQLPYPAPGLSLDLNQRKNFDHLPSPTSPSKVPSALSPKQQRVSPTKTCETATKPMTTEPSSPKPKINNTKRTGKESLGKNEKSLQNTVEKLTLNRVKELTKTTEEAMKKKTTTTHVNNSNKKETNQQQQQQQEKRKIAESCERSEEKVKERKQQNNNSEKQKEIVVITQNGTTEGNGNKEKKSSVEAEGKGTKENDKIEKTTTTEVAVTAKLKESDNNNKKANNNNNNRTSSDDDNNKSVPLLTNNANNNNNNNNSSK